MLYILYCLNFYCPVLLTTAGCCYSSGFLLLLQVLKTNMPDSSISLHVSPSRTLLWYIYTNCWILYYFCLIYFPVAKYSCCLKSSLPTAPIARYPYSAHRLMILLSVIFSAFTPTVLLNIYIAQEMYLRYCSILHASDTPDVRYFCYLKVLLIDSPAGRYS
jgi:hypothetical protein